MIDRFGEPRLDLESCESTQLLVDTSLPEGAIVVADHQTAGRGRLGRTWETPPGKALLVSILLRPPDERNPAEISLVAGVAVADALERTLGLSVQLKWPNDVMLRRRKVAGCLAEARDDVVVLGIGVNVNQTRDELPATAGSVLTLTGRELDREDLLATLLEDLVARYRAWSEGGLGAVYEGLGPRDFLRGRNVSVNGTSGVATMIDRQGRLEIRVAHGETVAVESGEVLFER
ncbi:MAG TPA: biotin--[acetyl-CoA-carboxylase] ligase [Gaiellaceae bacterium]|nr:biotin--[acetyl-CoA-carboxylase] ligase [Gaiellaceae bacterium]